MDAVVVIEDVLHELIDAWNRGDAVAFAERFSPDAEYTTGTGQSIRGRASIAALVAAGVRIVLVAGPFVACDGTTARGRFDWATAATEAGAARRGAITCILERRGSQWMIESLRNEEAVVEQGR